MSGEVGIVSVEDSLPAEAAASARRAFVEYVRGVEYKRILSDIGALQHRRNFRSVAVLSRASGEGKTFVSSVLALGYALFLRRRVLILDTIAQASRSALYLAPVLTQAFGADEGMPGGVVDVMTTRELETGETRGANHIGGADFAIGEFIERVRDDYDLIVVDTCALEAATINTLDPLVVGRQTDVAILVTSPQTVHRDVLSRIGGELRRREVDLVGTIYNSGVVR